MSTCCSLSVFRGILNSQFSNANLPSSTAFGCTCEINLQNVNPLLVNHPEQTNAVTKVSQQFIQAGAHPLLKLKSVSPEGLPMMGGEDFAYYTQKIPGCYFFLGTAEPERCALAAIRFKVWKDPATTQQVGEDAAAPEESSATAAPTIFDVAAPPAKTGSKNASAAGGPLARPAADAVDTNRRSNCICHGTSYDFNDNVLPRAVLLFVKIVEERFSTELLSAKEVEKLMPSGTTELAGVELVCDPV